MSAHPELERKMSGSRVDMKIVLLGKEYGGKTSLVERYLHNRWSGDVPYQNTIGAAFGAKRVEVDGQALVLGIWDTAGSERYEAMSRIYYRGAKAAVVCFDLTDDASFDRAKFWIQELRRNEEKCKIYLAGTKKDLIGKGENKRERAVDYHTTTDFADEINAQLYETSSKTGDKIGEMFTKIANDYVKDPDNNIGSPKEDNSLHLEETKQKRKQKCCA